MNALLDFLVLLVGLLAAFVVAIITAQVIKGAFMSAGAWLQVAVATAVIAGALIYFEVIGR